MDGRMCLEGARGVLGAGARAGRGGGEVVQMIRVLYLEFPGRGSVDTGTG